MCFFLKYCGTKHHIKNQTQEHLAPFCDNVLPKIMCGRGFDCTWAPCRPPTPNPNIKNHHTGLGCIMREIGQLYGQFETTVMRSALAFCQGLRGLDSFIELISQANWRGDHALVQPWVPSTTWLPFSFFISYFATKSVAKVHFTEPFI